MNDSEHSTRDKNVSGSEPDTAEDDSGAEERDGADRGARVPLDKQKTPRAVRRHRSGPILPRRRGELAGSLAKLRQDRTRGPTPARAARGTGPLPAPSRAPPELSSPRPPELRPAAGDGEAGPSSAPAGPKPDSQRWVHLKKPKKCPHCDFGPLANAVRTCPQCKKTCTQMAKKDALRSKRLKAAEEASDRVTGAPPPAGPRSPALPPGHPARDRLRPRPPCRPPRSSSSSGRVPWSTRRRISRPSTSMETSPGSPSASGGTPRVPGRRVSPAQIAST